MSAIAQQMAAGNSNSDASSKAGSGLNLQSLGEAVSKLSSSLAKPKL